MGRDMPFQCEVTVSSGVKEKLSRKRDIDIWEIEEVIYDDPNAFSIRPGMLFCLQTDLIRKIFARAFKNSEMNDEELADFWEKHEPEAFGDWEEGSLDFKRSPKRLIQLRLDPQDVRIIDRESKQSGIDRAQLVRSWVKKKSANWKKR